MQEDNLLHSSGREEAERRARIVPFYEGLDISLERRGRRLEGMCRYDDAVARRVLEEYGAMFVASERVCPPPVCVFMGEEEVLRFQEEVGFRGETVNTERVELQPAAMESLLEACAEARRQGLDITPRDGPEAGRRTYEDTLRLWNSRFLPALDYWSARGRLTSEQIDLLRSLPPLQQVAAVLELEASGIFFSKDFSKTILQSVAPPGASQHLSMLAFDVAEFRDERVRQVLARHGWFQTVKSDLPHFTFLGVAETDLPYLGLRRVEAQSQAFWIPNV